MVERMTDQHRRIISLEVCGGEWYHVEEKTENFGSIIIIEMTAYLEYDGSLWFQVKLADGRDVRLLGTRVYQVIYA